MVGGATLSMLSDSSSALVSSTVTAGPKKGKYSKAKCGTYDDKNNFIDDEPEGGDSSDECRDGTALNGEEGKGKRLAIGFSAPPRRRPINSIVTGIVDPLTISQPANHISLQDLGLSELAVELSSKTTPLLDLFVQRIHDHDIRCDVLPKYTPNIDTIQHILDLPAIRN
ncbi:hypothetical protein EKO04_001033 [Ascochyta lentis]|uniref:Uncharacterized protein n=1 Tax=Ascochyta lentis TaxID=205686 RepID=A0A8H7ML61_9PLEO|nr:hypothetical protein EKO04_001033 [Ascochyta lentis]